MTSPPSSNLESLCGKIAQATDLQEGPQGVEAVLRAVHRLQPASSKEVARELGLPVPVVAAIRRELERRRHER